MHKKKGRQRRDDFISKIIKIYPKAYIEQNVKE